MNNVVSLTGLDTLARQIKTEHLAVREAARLGIEHAMKCGDLLIKAKPQVPHGQWLPWLEECGFGDRTAQLYMRLARNRAELESKLESKYATIADLSLNEADKLLRDSQSKRYFETEERIITRATAITSPTKTTNASVPVKIVAAVPDPQPEEAPEDVTQALIEWVTKRGGNPESLVGKNFCPSDAVAIMREIEAYKPAPVVTDAPDDDHGSTSDIWELWNTNALIGPDSSFTLEQRLKALDKLEFDVHQLRNRLLPEDEQYTTVKMAKSYGKGFGRREPRASDPPPVEATATEPSPETSPVEPTEPAPAPLEPQPMEPTDDAPKEPTERYWSANFGTVQWRKERAIARAHDLGDDDLLKKLKTGRWYVRDLDAIEIELLRRETEQPAE